MWILCNTCYTCWWDNRCCRPLFLRFSNWYSWSFWLSEGSSHYESIMLQYMLCLYISLRDSRLLFSMTARTHNFEIVCRRQRSGLVAPHTSCRGCAWAVSRAGGGHVLPHCLLPCTAGCAKYSRGHCCIPLPQHTWNGILLIVTQSISIRLIFF